jgi:hypothetical protein
MSNENRHIVKDSSWKTRSNKTRQDKMPMGERDRVHKADRIRSWSMEHKPVSSGDWLRFR